MTINSVFVSFVDVGHGTHDMVGHDSGDMVARVILVHGGAVVHVWAVCEGGHRPMSVRVVQRCRTVHGTVVRDTFIVLHVGQKSKPQLLYVTRWELHKSENVVKHDKNWPLQP